eukprot:1179435-Prorocentrum_minimum.AAC.3
MLCAQQLPPQTQRLVARHVGATHGVDLCKPIAWQVPSASKFICLEHHWSNRTVHRNAGHNGVAGPGQMMCGDVDFLPDELVRLRMHHSGARAEGNTCASCTSASYFSTV